MSYADKHEFGSVERILLAVDMHDPAPHVRDYAADLARTRGARLIAVTAIGTRVGPYARPLSMADAAAEKDLAEQFLADYCSAVDGSLTEWEVAVGRMPDAILEVVCRRDIDLLVIGAHGRRGIGREVHRTIAEKLIRLCPCPVLALPVPEPHSV